MIYYYKNALYDLVDPIRETLFELLKKTEPEKIVSIKDRITGKKLEVPISKLHNYSIVRNRVALGLPV